MRLCFVLCMAFDSSSTIITAACEFNRNPLSRHHRHRSFIRRTRERTNRLELAILDFGSFIVLFTSLKTRRPLSLSLWRLDTDPTIEVDP